jgi:hypothetical protein
MPLWRLSHTRVTGWTISHKASLHADRQKRVGPRALSQEGRHRETQMAPRARQAPAAPTSRLEQAASADAWVEAVRYEDVDSTAFAGGASDCRYSTYVKTP